jgi:hypothetical protein
MTVEKAIRDALLTFGDPVQIFPFEKESPSATPPERYYTFQINTIGIGYADNAPRGERCMVNVHFICPLDWDSVARVKATKQALFDAGTSWPSKYDLSDANTQDIVFECQWLDGDV